MEINYLFNFWDNLFAIISIVVGIIITICVHKLSKQLSAKEKYQHEIKITEEIRKLKQELTKKKPTSKKPILEFYDVKSKSKFKIKMN